MGWFAFAAWYGTLVDGSALFPDIPGNRWVFEGIALAKKNRILAGYPSGFIYHEPIPSRQKVAEQLFAATRGYDKLVREMLRDREAIATNRVPLEKLGDARENYAWDLKNFPEAKAQLHFLRRGHVYFWPQLLSMGVSLPSEGDLERLTQRVQTLGPVEVGERLKPFADIPKGHWASEAVGELRALGLVEGYPGGRFGG